MKLSDSGKINSKNMLNYYKATRENWLSILKYDDQTVVTSLDEYTKYFSSFCKSKDVLELASGVGFYSKNFKEQAMNFTASDINSDCSSYHDNFLVLDAFNLSLNKTYDIIIANDWFCHVSKPDISNHLTELFSHINDGGSLVFGDQQLGKALNGANWGKNISLDSDKNTVNIRPSPTKINYTIIKNFYTDEEYKSFYDNVTVKRFNECNRLIVSYSTPPTK
jgi:2-polyprenyl-3-methyl-5-hydroxy-6-metoxy-1,4-benzoquinol methylase